MRATPALGFLMLCFVSMYGFLGCSNEIDAISTTSDNRAPLLGPASIVPNECGPGTDAILFSVEVGDRDGASDLAEVKAVEMLESLGAYTLRDDGGSVDVNPSRPGFQGSGDLIADDGIFTSLGRAPDTTGTFIFTFSARDRRGVVGPTVTRTLVVN